MARSTRACCLAAVLITSAQAQRSTQNTPTPSSFAAASSSTDAPSSSITATPDTTFGGIPMSLWSLATSLLTHYYPSTTITNFNGLTLPGTLVIGDHTYTLSPSHTSTSVHSTAESKTTATSRAAASNFGEAASVDQHDQMGDKTLSIIIGVVVGALALAIMGMIFFCLHRRRKQTGSFFLRRRTPSPDDWHSSHDDTEPSGNISYTTMGGTPYEQQRQPKLPQVTEIQQRGPTPPLNMHPAALYTQSSRSTSDDNPFLTPQERSSAGLNEILSREPHAELDHVEPAARRSSISLRDSRPPTPFSPLMMQQMPGPSQRPRIHVNPFASAEDREAEDIVSPIVPTRSPERRYSPIVHYPSWDEVSEFNFSGDERDGLNGGDGFRPARVISRERSDGRHELA